jgi:ADP-ribose pyrophosphatase YjhB (NUDIX family)
MDLIRRLHLGAYGIIEDKQNVLVVRKSRGPYKGLYDLPGGQLCHGETIQEGLRREILEETGMNALQFRLKENFAFTVPYQNNDTICELYHVALIYFVTVDMIGFNPGIHEEDVLGSLWIPRAELNNANSSPLILKGLNI